MYKGWIMDADIEKSLMKSRTHIIDYATIKNILINNGFKSIKDKINNLKKKKILRTLIKGFYIHNSLYIKNIISKEIISNNILGPSYISFDYALSYYNLIPEAVYHITSATTKRSKKFETNYGTFNYKQIKKELFGIGLTIESLNSCNFLIAKKEKALCDKIYYFSKDIKITSKKAMLDYLINDLRIDFDEFFNNNSNNNSPETNLDFDGNIIKEYYKISRSKKIKLLLNVIEEIVK